MVPYAMVTLSRELKFARSHVTALLSASNNLEVSPRPEIRPAVYLLHCRSRYESDQILNKGIMREKDDQDSW